MSLNKIFIILILISPFFWWQFLNKHNQIFFEYRQTPTYIKNKVASIFLNTKYIDEFRWNDVTINNHSLIGKLFYNKAHLVITEIVTYFNNLNPRFYFQSGSGQTDSPPQIEPIAFLILPCSLLGIFKLIKKYKYKIIILAVISCFFGYITGHSNIYYLFPTFLFYLFAGAYEIFFWTRNKQTIFLSILFIYSLFLFFRVFFITSV